MTARAFLVRGLIAGLLAGVAAFLVAFTVGEPPVERAIALEQAAAAPAAGDHGGHAHDHAHGDGETDTGGVSRTVQSTLGLATATISVGVALGGLVGIAAAVALGRLGRLGAVGSTAVVSVVGFVAVSLLPFLKYAPAPPAVGSGETIGDRTAVYFAFLLLSVAAAVVAVVVATRVFRSRGGFAAVVVGSLGYVAVMTVAALAMPVVDELGDFPASTLWQFRLGSLFTLTTLWATIGVVLTGLVARLHGQDAATRERRELAASL